MRLWLEEVKVELAIILVVMLYTVVIFADLSLPSTVCTDVAVRCALPDPDPPCLPLGAEDVCDPSEMTLSVCHGKQCRAADINNIFLYVDYVFLTAFMIELLIKCYAWGFRYFFNAEGRTCEIVNSIDAVVVVISFVFMILITPSIGILDGKGAESVQDAMAIARTLRLVKIFRLLTVMNKLQKSRSTAHVLRKKAQYRRSGSPVERVLEILTRLKKHSESAQTRDDIAFIMDIIISDQLYSVNLSTATAGLSKEMAAFIQNTGVASVTRKAAAKPKPAEAEASGGDANGGGDGGAPRAAGRRASFSMAATDATYWVDQLFEQDAVQTMLQKYHLWEFDPFAFDEVTGRKPLVASVMHLVKVNNLDEELGFDCSKLVRFLTKVQDGMNDVPFHNYMHITDVVHGTAYFLSQEKLKALATPLDFYTMILSAAMHDFDHPGYNNAYLCTTRNHLAILYNDDSVLESFHVASSWRLMLMDELDPFAGLSAEDYAEARQTAVTTILGTDMKFHFDHLSKFKTRASGGTLDAPDRKDMRLILAMCLHGARPPPRVPVLPPCHRSPTPPPPLAAADVSNPAKPWKLSSEWTSRVMTEFFRQGDMEMDRGLAASPFMDRAKTNIAQCQVGFINILIKPFYEEWCAWLGGTSEQDCVENIVKNIAMWQDNGEEVLGDRLAQVKTRPESTPRTAAAEGAPLSVTKESKAGDS